MMMKDNPASIEKAEEIKTVLARMLLKFFAEVNDAETRAEVVELYTDFLKEQELNDFTVVCDEVNNTDERVAANELWVDIALQYEPDELFIYIPLRLAPAPNA